MPPEAAVLDTPTGTETGTPNTEAADDGIISFDETDTPAAEAQESAAPSVESKDNLRKAVKDMSRAELIDLFGEDSSLVKELSKDIRNRDIDRRAEVKAQTAVEAKLSEVNEKLEAIAARNKELETAADTARLSEMTDEQQEAHRLRKDLEAATAELNEHRSYKNTVAQERAKDDLIDHFAKEWGLDEPDELEALRKEETAQKLVDKAMKMGKARLEKLRAEVRSLGEKVAAKARVEEGTSAHAATAPAVSGGEMSRQSIRDKYANADPDDPGYAELSKLYAERVLGIK